MAFSLACDAGKTTLRIEGTDNNVTWNDVVNAGAGSVAVDGGGTDLYPDWVNGQVYAAGDQVEFTDSGVTKLYFTLSGGTSSSVDGPAKDTGVYWQPYDPVTAACQSNSILLITDGASTSFTPSSSNFSGGPPPTAR